LNVLEKYDLKKAFLGCKLGLSADGALHNMFEDTNESPIVNRCGTHTFSRAQKSLINPGFSEIDKKMKSNGYSADKFMQALVS